MVGNQRESEMKIKSGGGYLSNKTVHSQHYKTEPKAKVIDPAAVAAQGLAVQFKKPELEQGRGYEPGPNAEDG
jgi:hypothetical protein